MDCSRWTMKFLVQKFGGTSVRNKKVENMLFDTLRKQLMKVIKL